MADVDLSFLDSPKEVDLSFLGESEVDLSFLEPEKPKLEGSVLKSIPQEKPTSGFLGGPIQEVSKPTVEELSFESMSQELPDIPDGIRAVDPDKAEQLFKIYEDKGKDPGYEVVNYFSKDGIKKQIRPKVYLKADEKTTFEDDRNFRDFFNSNMNKYYNSNILDQFAEGFGGALPSQRSPEQVVGKISELHPQYAQDTGAHDIPWEHLTPAQKTAYAVGYGTGFMATGTAISKVAQGTLVAGARVLGPTAARALAWLEGAGSSAGVKVSESVGKVAGEAVGEFTGNVTRSLVQQGPVMSVEGIVFEGLRTDGDVKAMAEGAVAFPLIGAVGGEALQAGARKISQSRKKKLAKMILENKNNPFKTQSDEILKDPDYVIMKTVEKAMVESEAAANQVSTQIKNQNKINTVNKQIKGVDDELDRIRGKGTREDIEPEELKRFLGKNERRAELERKRENLLKKKNALEKDPLYDPKLDASKLKNVSKDQLRIKLFKERMRTYGVPLNAESGTYYRLFGKIMNQSERFSLIQEKFHYPVGKLPMMAIEGSYAKNKLLSESEAFNINKNLKNLRKMNVDEEQAWEWFHYIRKREDGSYAWDPSELKTKKYTVPEFKGEAPTQEVQDILFEFRKMTDWNHSIMKAYGLDPGYTHGYMAIMPKVEFGAEKIFVPKTGKSGKPGFLKKRTQGIIPKEERHLYHTDFYSMIPVMNQKAINAAVFNQFDKAVDQAYFMARATGRDDLGEMFLKYRETVKGHKPGDHDARKIYASDVVAGNADALEGLARITLKNEPGFIQEAMATANNLMYHSYIGLSTATLIKQFMQPYLVGAAEVGQKNIMEGIIGAYGRGNFVSMAKKAGIPVEKAKLIFNESQAALDRVKDRLIPSNINYELLSEPQKQGLKAWAKVMNLPSQPGMKAFSYLDSQNRKVSFLAGRRAFEKAQKKGAGALSELLDQMIVSEKTQVLQAYEKYGIEAAKDEAGLIFAKRHNFAYSLAERGELFASGIGRHIPFVHWGANTWMRHMENIRNKKFGTLAKRMGYAYAGVLATQNLMGERFHMTQLGPIEMSSGLPQSSMLGMSSVTPLAPLEAMFSLEGFAPYRLAKKAGAFDDAKSRKAKRKYQKDKEKEKDVLFRITLPKKGKKKRVLEF